MADDTRGRFRELTRSLIAGASQGRHAAASRKPGLAFVLGFLLSGVALGVYFRPE
jgi:hypothetical protein